MNETLNFLLKGLCHAEEDPVEDEDTVQDAEDEGEVEDEDEGVVEDEDTESELSPSGVSLQPLRHVISTHYVTNKNSGAYQF